MVGGGLTEEGANARRWDDKVQRAFYTGWKSIHGLKYQTVDIAYGFTCNIAGPISLRHSDLRLLLESDMKHRLAELPINEERQLVIFGDSAY